MSFSYRSADDPYLILAALAPSTQHKTGFCETMFVTRDNLQDHYACLETPEAQRIMTYWQAYHQIKPIVTARKWSNPMGVDYQVLYY